MGVRIVIQVKQLLALNRDLVLLLGCAACPAFAVVTTVVNGDLLAAMINGGDALLYVLQCVVLEELAKVDRDFVFQACLAVEILLVAGILIFCLFYNMLGLNILRCTLDLRQEVGRLVRY